MARKLLPPNQKMAFFIQIQPFFSTRHKAPVRTTIPKFILEAIRIVGGESGGAVSTSLFKIDFDFNKMGIGGLDEEFSQIFRRAFASRIFPPNVVAKLGIHHVKGNCLHI
jgi:hypothetical protein